MLYKAAPFVMLNRGWIVVPLATGWLLFLLNVARTIPTVRNGSPPYARKQQRRRPGQLSAAGCLQQNQ